MHLYKESANLKTLQFDPDLLPPVHQQPEIRWVGAQIHLDAIIPLVLVEYSIGGVPLYLRYDLDKRIFIDMPPKTVDEIRGIRQYASATIDMQQKIDALTDDDVTKLENLLKQSPFQLIGQMLRDSTPKKIR